MLQFHLSKVLAKDMAMHLSDTVAERPGALRWFAHRVTINRRKCVLVMEQQSRYCLVLCGLTKADFENFAAEFQERLWCEVVSICGLEGQACEQLRERVLMLSEDCVFVAGHDRSVQAHINDVAWHLEDQAYREGELPLHPAESFAFGAFVNDLLRKRKGEKEYFKPLEVFREFWLGMAAQLESQPELSPQVAGVAETTPLDHRPIPDNVLPFRRKTRT